MSLRLTASVGRGGKNKKADVSTVQLVLRLDPTRQGPPIPLDGSPCEVTVSAIEEFQRKVPTAEVNGRVDPDGSTWLMMQNASAAAIQARTWIGGACAPRLNEFDYAGAATRLRCELAAIKAVAEVESSGDGFFASGRPKILFEAHLFSFRTARKYDAAFPDISSKTRNTALYAYGEREYERLEKAMLLDRRAALKSASWGRFQILGSNHKLAGHAKVEDYVAAMCTSERGHLDAFVSFVTKKGIDVALRSKDWAAFAFVYNGPKYAEHNYDGKMKAAYVKHSKLLAKK